MKKRSRLFCARGVDAVHQKYPSFFLRSIDAVLS